MEENERLALQAMVFLETYGSTTFQPEEWKKWGFAEKDYCPSWLEHDPDRCITVLNNGLGTLKVPKGYKYAYAYPCGEKECPECGPGSGNESNRPECELCEGEGLIHWGCEWQVLVFEKKPKKTKKELKKIVKGLLKEIDLCIEDGSLSAQAVSNNCVIAKAREV